MPSAAFLSALSLIRNVPPDQVRALLNPRDFEIALNSIGISSTDLEPDEMQVLREELYSRSQGRD